MLVAGSQPRGALCAWVIGMRGAAARPRSGRPASLFILRTPASYDIGCGLCVCAVVRLTGWRLPVTVRALCCADQPTHADNKAGGFFTFGGRRDEDLSAEKLRPRQVSLARSRFPLGGSGVCVGWEDPQRWLL
jgi:hypothetical protein